MIRERLASIASRLSGLVSLKPKCLMSRENLFENGL